MGLAQGASVGQARGSIYIDVSQLATAQAGVNSFSQNVTVTLNQINNSTNKAQRGISDLGRAFGISFGAAGVVQLAKFVVEANKVAVAFDRQTIAARNLAGGQSQLNELLDAYARATGGAIDKAQALADVTRLQAVGMGDSAAELERFVSASRGAAVAMGRSTQDILGEVQLAIANQSFRRLDQIGLGVDEVHRRMDELKASTKGMTTEAAFQEAVISRLEEKFGDLTKSVEAQATGVEHAQKAWKDFRLEFGEATKGIVDFTGDAFANWLTQTTKDVKTLTDFLGPLIHQYQELAWWISGKNINFMNGLNIQQPNLLPSAANFNLPKSGPVSDSTEVSAAKLDWAKGIIQLNADTNEQLQQQNSDYQRQRADSERQFQTSTTRANEDFMLARARQEQDLADTIARIHSDAARREERQAEDLARNIAQATTDSAEKVANARDDANKRLVELDEDYEKARVKRAKDLSDKLLDAAGNLDAKQVYQLQRDAAKQEEEAKTAHDDARDKIGEQLQEKLDDEAKSLAKSIAQQQDAYNRQLADAREADAQRVTDMEADAVKRRAQEDYDFGLRMERARVDHDDQMAEMERAQGERLAQIQTHAQQERDQLDDEHKRQLDELMNHHSEWNKELVKQDDEALKEFERLTHPIRVWLKQPTAFLPTPTGLPIGASGYTVPGSGAATGGSTYNSRAFNPTVNVTIQGSTTLGKSDIESAVHDALLRVFEETN